MNELIIANVDERFALRVFRGGVLDPFLFFAEEGGVDDTLGVIDLRRVDVGVRAEINAGFPARDGSIERREIIDDGKSLVLLRFDVQRVHHLEAVAARTDGGVRGGNDDVRGRLWMVDV